jgi:hypothetical protein
MALHPFVGPWPLFQFLDLLYTVYRTPWTGDQPVARPSPACGTAQIQNKAAQQLKRLVAGFPPLRSGVRNRTWSCGICGGTKWRWGRFSQSSSVSLAIVVRSTNYSTITLMYHPGNAQ